MANFTVREQKYILITLIVALGIVLFQEMRMFLAGFMGATTLYVLLRGQNKWLIEQKGWHSSLSATVMLLEAIFIFLIPLSLLLIMAVNTTANIRVDFSAIQSWLFQLIDMLENRFNVEIYSEENIKRLLSPETISAIPKLSGSIFQFITSNSYSLIINVMVVLFVLYFMLYSYRGFENMVYELLPFREKNKRLFIQEGKSIIQANAIGIPLIALIQGGLSYLGYLYFGVDNPLLIAVFTAFATIIPVVGTVIVYVPVVISLLLTGSYHNAIGLLIYSILIVGSSDNVIRLLLQKKMADIHPLITLFGVLTGLAMFGFWGVIYGPLLLSLFVLMLNMYRLDYVENTKATLKTNRKVSSKSPVSVKIIGMRWWKKVWSLCKRNGKK